MFSLEWDCYWFSYDAYGALMDKIESGDRDMGEKIKELPSRYRNMVIDDPGLLKEIGEYFDELFEELKGGEEF